VIAALFVETNGAYYGLDGVDPWDVERDARLYDGPWPVVAHPPCERWGRYWYGGPMRHKQGRRMQLGDDSGCFAAALNAVRRFGGVLEHPEASHAWKKFGLNAPPRAGGWVVADFDGGWTCCVEQGHYGHRARKATWLYAYSAELPTLKWGKSAAGVRLDQGFHSKEERRRAQRLGTLRAVGEKRMPRRECAATPVEFRDLLISIAESANARKSVLLGGEA
jgi:hypothetical protein